MARSVWKGPFVDGYLLKKAERSRGSAMDPGSHPHGGGEGKAPIGLPGPKTPWGKPARGVRTRRNKATDKFIARSRHLRKSK